MDFGFELKGCRDVYGPREDSFLLLDCVNRYAFGDVLDLGTGTGIQGIAASVKCNTITFSDIDKRALKCAKDNVHLNNIIGKFILSDLFNSITGKFNTIIFNPPYVPTNEIENTSTDGLHKGRIIIDRFLKEFDSYIKEDHIVLILESSLNDYNRDVKKYNAKIIAKKNYFFEEIVVLLLQ